MKKAQSLIDYTIFIIIIAIFAAYIAKFWDIKTVFHTKTKTFGVKTHNGTVEIRPYIKEEIPTE